VRVSSCNLGRFMKTIFVASLALALQCAAAQAQSLIDVTSSAEAAVMIRANPEQSALIIATTIGLGVADPVTLVFELIAPQTPSAEANATAAAVTIAAPRAADEVAAATALAAGITADEPRLISLIRALAAALQATDWPPDDQAAEMLEVLAALLAVTYPSLRMALADAAATTPAGGAALLAALGKGPKTAAITAPRSFGTPPISLTLAPNNAAQDAPSAN